MKLKTYVKDIRHMDREELIKELALIGQRRRAGVVKAKKSKAKINMVKEDKDGQ